MNSIYLGVDVAGTKNTWVSALSPSDGRLTVVCSPRPMPLKEVVEYCEQSNVVAVAIDAQLTISLSEDSGVRTSDLHLRELLPPDCRNWVASINSLMAVPVRGRLLADSLSPIVGTLLETHPRASLLFGLEQIGQEIQAAVREYKRNNEAGKAHILTLWQHWSERFDISYRGVPGSDGALDSLVCATVAHQFHHAPTALYKLRHQVAEKTGRGPFYVLAPTLKRE